jgi:hypothetical protein
MVPLRECHPITATQRLTEDDMSEYIKADGDARCITIKRVEAGSYVVMLDHVVITDATINKVGNGWEITSLPIGKIEMSFRTLKDAKAHMLSWFRFSYVPMLNADHSVAERETPYTGTRTIAAIKAEGKISRMDYPVPYGRVVTEAHVKICNEYGCVTYVKNDMDMGYCPRCGEVTTSEKQITKEEIDSQEIENVGNPIDDVIRFANEAIAALMPNLAATKLAFETLRDDESANPNHVDLAYQVYTDTHRAIEEYRRTIAYAEA